MTTTLKIKYAAIDILENDPTTVNIVYYSQETNKLFGMAYHMKDSEDRAFVKKLMEVMNVATFQDMVDKDVRTA